MGGGGRIQRRTRFLTDEEVVGALDAVLAAAGDLVHGVEFCLVGTASSLVRGIRLPVGDVEFVARDRRTVEALFSRIMAERPDLPPSRQSVKAEPDLLRTPQVWFYNVGWQIGRVSIGWSTCEPPGGLPEDPEELPPQVRAVFVDSDLYECLGQAPWLHSDQVQVASHSVPCVATELRLVSELIRRRPERYEPIIDWLADHRTDVDLLQRSIEERGVDLCDHPRVAGLLT